MAPQQIVGSRERNYEERLNNQGDVLRVRFATERGRMARFMVQYEVFVEEHLYPAVRYDSAHGVPHRDTLDWAGRTIQKEWFPDRTHAQVLTEAKATIKADWPRLRAEFLRRRP